MTKAKRFAVSYLRFSSRKQAKGSSADRQEWLLKEYLETNPDIELIDSFTDKGVSGFRGKHATNGDLARLIEAVLSGVLPTPLVLIIESIDRLGREPLFDAFGRFSQIVNAGVTIAVCDMRIELNRETMKREKWRLRQVIDQMERANEESQRKSDLVTQAWNRNIRLAVAEGRAVKGYVGPPWVSRDKKSGHYTVAEKDRPTVETLICIFGWAANGKSPHAIAKLLNELKVPEFRAHMSKHRQRQGWYQSYVSTLLQNRQVLGEHRFRDGEVMEGYFPEIVTPELFHRVKQRLDSVRRQGKAGAKGKTFSNLFTHVAKCKCCGGSMEMGVNRRPTEDGPEPIKYLASSNRKRRKGCTSSGGINYPKLEKTVLDALPLIPWSEIVREENPNDPLPEMDLAIARESLEVERLTKAVARLEQMVEDGDVGEDFKDRYKARKADLAQTKARLEHFQSDRARVASEWANRPGLVTTAIGYRDTMTGASEAEQFVIRERLAGALREMITDMLVDLPEKRVTITYGDRWHLIIAFPLRQTPVVTHAWSYPVKTPSAKALKQMDGLELPGLDEVVIGVRTVA